MMIKLFSVSSDLILKFRQNSFFDEFLFYNAYPRTVKPTRLSHPAIAVKLSNLDFEEASIGSQVMAGSVSVSADIFIPPSHKNLLSVDEIISQICKSAAGMRIVSLSCEKPYNDNYADCFVQKIIITFNDEICFEEQE